MTELEGDRFIMNMFKHNNKRHKYAAPKRRRKPPRQLENKSSQGLSYTLVIILLCTLVWFVAAATILYQRAYPSYQYVIGQIADRDIYSEVPFQYTDVKATKQLRNKEKQKEPLVFQISRNAVDATLQKLNKAKQAILTEPVQKKESTAASATEATEKTDAENAKKEETQTTPTVAAEDAKLLADVFKDDDKWNSLRTLFEQTLSQGVGVEKIKETLDNEIGPEKQVRLLFPTQSRSTMRPVDEIPDTSTAAAKIVDEFNVAVANTDKKTTNALRELLKKTIAPTIAFDPATTEANRERAAESIEPVTTSVGIGVRLLQRGEKVTQEHIERLKTHSVELQADLKQRHGARRTVIISLLTLALVLGFGRGLIDFDRKILSTRRDASLIATVVIIQIIFVRVIADILHLQGLPAIILNSALPLSLGALLLTQLVGFRVAVWSCIFTSLITALQLEQWSFKVLLSGMIAGFVGAMLMRQARRRSHVFRAGLWVGIATFLTSSLFYLGTDVPYGYLAQIAAVSLINGMTAAVFASTILPLLEFIFGVTTDISLLELSDLNHPLLKRLQMEAPGTFHHSLLVATLAEQTAAAIGANPLLTRVCAYFHDIGKIAQPEYFTENNMATDGHDAHRNLQPRMSSLIILNHVKEGLDLATKYKLSKPIREAIAQHHGTSLIYYFYRRAIDRQNEKDKDGGNIGQQDYRYPGPHATRKEIVLIGLADSCEAAVRSMEKPSPQKIKTLVEEIVMQRIQDGQLDEADLTFQELALAKNTMTKTLGNMFHGRIQYPKDELQQNKNDETEPDNPDTEAEAKKTE